MASSLTLKSARVVRESVESSFGARGSLGRVRRRPTGAAASSETGRHLGMTARAGPCPPLSSAHNESVQALTLRPLRRWLAPDRPPSRRTRVTLEIVILAALAVTDAATGSETVVLLVLLGLLLVVVPIASRVLDEDEPDPSRRRFAAVVPSARPPHRS